MNRPLELTREQILAYRRNVGALDERLPPSPESLQRAAWVGLQDSTPRAALLSIHARVAETGPSAWDDPSLVQLWGPRFSAYVVAAADRAIFTLGRLPDEPRRQRSAQDLADRLQALLGGRRLTYREAGRALGEVPNRLRYAAPTGRVLIRWEGSGQPTIWIVPPPEDDVRGAGLELARRYLHILGPATPESFAEWAGIAPAAGRARFDALGRSLTPVRTPVGDGFVLTTDGPAISASESAAAAARLLPSGDAYFLLQGPDRALLVADPARRLELWTPRVWPGAVLVDGEVVGTWRRASSLVTVHAWRRLSPPERLGVEAEAASLPLPGVRSSIRVRWAD